MERDFRINKEWAMKVVRREANFLRRFGSRLSAHEVTARLGATDSFDRYHPLKYLSELVGFEELKIWY